MVSLSLSFIGILLPAAVLCLSDEGKQYILDTAGERKVLLNLHYETYWETLMNMDDKDNTWLKSSDSEIELDAMSTKTFLSALDDRVAAIHLNVICWRCAWYFKAGVSTLFKQKKSNDEYVEPCAKIGDTVSWYNEKFSARIFFEAYKKWLRVTPENSAPLSQALQSVPLAGPSTPNPRSADSEGRLAKGIDEIFGITVEKIPIYTDDGERIDIEELVRKLDRVLQRLKTMNEIFKTANLNYEDVFQKLRERCTALDETDRPKKGLFQDFHERCNNTLWKFLGAEYTDIIKYMDSFLGKRTVYQNFHKEAEKQYEYIKNAEGIGKEYPEVLKIVRLNNNLIYASLEALGIQPQSRFGRRLWNVQRKAYGVSEFLFIFENNNNNN